MKIFAILIAINILFTITDFTILIKETYAQSADFKELRSDHFIISYHKDVDNAYVLQIKNIAEDFYRIITQEFNLIRDALWLWENRAKIFIAKDKTSYAKEFQCTEWSAACVNYKQKIIYTYPNQDNFKSILAHELAHIIFHEYIVRGNSPLWLDEGIATYIENKYENGSYERAIPFLKDKIRKSEYIKFSDLNTISYDDLRGSPSSEVSFFYLESFSIVNLMMKRYGKYNFSRFLTYFKSGDRIEAALLRAFYDAKNLGEVEKKWKTFYQE